MRDNELKNILSTSNFINTIIDQIKLANRVHIKGIAGSLKALFLSVLFDKIQSSIVYIAPDNEQEDIVKTDLEVLLGADSVAYFLEIREFADREVLFDSTTKNLLQSGFEKINENKQTISIVSAKNIVHKFPQPQFLNKHKLLLDVNEESDFEILKESLIALGFVRENLVENWGEMSVRGGIIDLYPYSSEAPYRIEFFGNTIESIRVFDPISQRSLKQLSRLTIYPQNPEELEISGQQAFGSLFDYFDDRTIIFFDEIKLIEKQVAEFFQYEEKKIKKEPTEQDSSYQNEYFLSWEKVQHETVRFHVLVSDAFKTEPEAFYFDFACQAQESLRGNLNLLKNKIEFYNDQKSLFGKPFRTFFLCESKEHVEHMQDLFQDADLDLNKLNLLNLGLNQGFIFRECGLAALTDNQFYGRPVRWKKSKKVGSGLTLQQLQSLTIGDFVVHVDKGIGRYIGLKKINVQKNERECLTLEYRDKDLLYVPLERMDRIQKYSAKEGAVPTLNKLGSRDWDRLKKKTKKQIKQIAKELTKLYAKRKIEQGFACAADSVWQNELEASFQYEDTPDQKKAAEEVKADMEKIQPMDRLVCGDVGYGKTEVAVRAAFKAVNSGKQAAILVPTTILALQHYDLIRDRLRKFPVTIEMLSRFKTRAEQKNIIEKLKLGSVDIVIGTHRLLSNDVQFKKLGLLVIDEEHRFGVSKKEAIKKKHVNVDVLSMSATPIPRTLNMSLLGIRDMSLIATPPRDRQPIHTEIVTFNLEIIRMAILKEIDRGGQVFFVHNRVRTIESMANMIRRIIPEISIAVAHGQMEEKQLEKVMWEFATKKYQCLVSTMIIESGLDIPNVNTLIVNRADKFGLAQLYQLRGRVGRSHQHANAYLLVPSIKSLTRNALKRLRIIEEFTELGSGFSVAMRDLEIRGAGNILGSEQSGHIAALGFDLYTKIIGEAVRELKLEQEGKPVTGEEKEEDVKVIIDRDAYLPDSYIDYPEFKVDIYRRLANETQLKQIKHIREEVTDRFGKMPPSVVNLFNLVELKLIGQRLDFSLIKITDSEMTCNFSDKIAQSDSRELIENKISWIIDKAKGKMYFVQGKNEGFGIRTNVPESATDAVDYCKNFLKNFL